MKKTLALYSLFFLMICTVGKLPVYADDGPMNDGTLNGLFAPTNSEQYMTSDSATPDLFTGIMKYSIPITVPAGRKGVEPKLALTYRSNQQNGWLGLGWELEVGSIEINVKKGTGYILRMNGAAVELITENDNEYYAKIESQFLRIKSYNTGLFITRWEVTDKQGTRYIFGQADSSRQANPENFAIFKWCLDYVVDTNGNYMTFSYFKDQGQIYLDTIEYTGNGTLSPRNIITFVRDNGTRPDVPIMCGANFGVETAYKLQRIEITADGNPIRSYVLDYDLSAGTSQSLLKSVQQYGKDGVSKMPPITMEYSPENVGFTSSGLWYQGLVERPYTDTYWGWVWDQYRFGDFNGDGRADVLHYDAIVYGPFEGSYYPGCNSVALSNSAGFDDAECWSPGENWFGWRNDVVADFNGDGKTDFAYTWMWSYGQVTSNVTSYRVGLSRGHGPGSVLHPVNIPNVGTAWYPAYSPDVGFGITDIQSSTALVAKSGEVWGRFRNADFNGDGSADVVYIGTDGTLEFYNAAVASTTMGYGVVDRYRFADFTGDGRADALYIGEGGDFTVATSRGTAFQAAEPWGSMVNGGDASRYLVGDFNGDGKSDLIFIDTSAHIFVALSAGYKFIVSDVPWATWGNGVIGYYRFGDFNGDGKTDILFLGGNYDLSVVLSTGSGFTSPLSWGSLGTGYGAAEGGWGRYVVADFTGDGRADVWYVSGNYGERSQLRYYVASMTAPADNLLTKISNGIGGTTTISYTKTNIPFPVQTVSSITTDDGNGVVATTSYNFGGGFYHIGERDFRGFNHVKVAGPEGPNKEQIVTETWFHQGNDTAVDVNNPNVSVGFMKGKPYRKRISVVDAHFGSDAIPGDKLAEVITSYAPDDAEPYFNPPQEVNTYICVNDRVCRQIKTIYSYDDYGNVTREDQYGDVNVASDDRTITRAYGYDTTSWIEGLPVGLPKSETIYQGIGTTTQKSKTTFYYDGADDCTVASTNQTPTKGNLTRVVRWLDGETSPSVRMAYDDYGNIKCTRDPKGYETNIGYDTTRTFPRITTNPLGHQAETTYYGVDGVAADYGLYGQVKSVADHNQILAGVSEVTKYDSFGRRIRTDLPDGTWTSWYYNNFGRLDSTADSQHIRTDTKIGVSAWTYFDGLGRTIREEHTGPGGRIVTTKTKYNRTGTIAETTMPYFQSEEQPPRKFKYDALGRAIQVTNPDTSIVLSCYDERATVGIDADGHRKREVRDPFGRLVEVNEYKGVHACTTDIGSPYATTTYEYDILGNLTKVTDANGNVTVMNYDTLGRKTSMQDPDMGEWNYTYDANGNLETQKDSLVSRTTITFAYDELNRVKKKDYPTGTDVSFTYDVSPDPTLQTYPVGRLSTMSDASGTTKYSYDIMGRPKTAIKNVDSTNYKITLDFTDGRMTSITYPDNEVVSYVFGAGNVLEAVKDPAHNYIYAYYPPADYTALGQPKTVNNGNSVSTAYAYSPLNNRLKKITTGSTAQLLDLTFDYFPGGAIQSIADNLHPYAPGVLAGGPTVTYSYHPTVRPHAVTSTTDGKTYTYDNNGNMKSDGERTILYDYDNMPSSINRNGAITHFVYDGNGSRVQKISPYGTTTYIDKFYECNAGTCTKYIFAGDARIASKIGGNITYYHQDHLGSTRVVTEEVVGDNIAELSYYPFGETQSETGTFSVTHKYTSQELDWETGLYNYNARLYNPSLGRFISADTIVPDPRNPQSLNRYSYVINNPLFYIDPTGQDYDAYIDFYPSSYDSDSGYGGGYGGGNGYGYTPETRDPMPSGTGGSMGGGGSPIGSLGNNIDNLAVQNLFQSFSLGNIIGDSHGAIVTVNYWPSAWGSFAMVWSNSWLPSFYRMGTLGSNGKIALPGIYTYKHGQHPMMPTTNPRTGKLKVPYPALNVYNPLYKLFGYDDDRSIPAFNVKKFGFDAIDGLNVHSGNSINNLECGGAGCHVLPVETWKSYIDKFPPGSSGLYINLW